MKHVIYTDSNSQFNKDNVFVTEHKYVNASDFRANSGLEDCQAIALIDDPTFDRFKMDWYSRCSFCNSIKLKVPNGIVTRKSRGKFYDLQRFRNEDGRLWNGNKCPDCYGQQTKLYKQRKQAAKKASN